MTHSAIRARATIPARASEMHLHQDGPAPVLPIAGR